jgi:GT2 family glycosyltransferase
MNSTDGHANNGASTVSSTTHASSIEQQASLEALHPTVAIVIPTYNSIGLLSGCLKSLRDLDYPKDRLTIVVVDNASRDGTASTLGARYPEVLVSTQEKNTGFAAACNRGAALADAEYVAFLNDDALAERGWLQGLFAGLRAGGEGAVCAASQIRSRDGRNVEYEGASSNLYGAGRPVSVWGWPDMPSPPTEGSPVLFASGGAMLIHRRTFLDVGGFDPEYFAYFEDVDLGWRLWLLGHKVVYAPGAVVRHIGGATGSRSPIYRRYTLWECNSLATILKNYEAGNVERILSAALMLQYRRALMASGDVIRKEAYALTGPPDTSTTNVEELPRISTAHLVAIDRLNALLPHLMKERRRIQAARVRSDAEILPLLGHAWQPQFAGSEYADIARKLASDFGLYKITGTAAPKRVLILASSQDVDRATQLASRLPGKLLVAVATIGEQSADSPIPNDRRFTLHRVAKNDPPLTQLTRHSDALVVFQSAARLDWLQEANTPTLIIGNPMSGGGRMPGHFITVENEQDPRIVSFCLEPTSSVPA